MTQVQRKNTPEKLKVGSFVGKRMLPSSCRCASVLQPEGGASVSVAVGEARWQGAATEHCVPSRGLGHTPAPGLSQATGWWGYYRPHFRHEG